MKGENSPINNANKKTYRGKYIFSIAFIVLCIFAGYIYKVITWEPKSNPESEQTIRKVVAKQLRKERKQTKIDPNELTDDDFKQIKKFRLLNDLGMLTIGSLELTDIKLLEKFANLEKLYAFDVKIPESTIPKWMKILFKLGIIDSDRNFSIDLSPIEKLQNLQELSLEMFPVSNIEPLKGLKNLRVLNLSQTQVTNLKPIQNLTNIEKLTVTDTQISDLKPLKKLIKLHTLSLYNTSVSDIEPLKGLFNLQSLTITQSLVHDLNPIIRLTNLKTLNINQTSVFNFEPLRRLASLQTLSIESSQISDLRPLKGLKNLQYLHISDCNNIIDEQVEELQKALPELTIYR